MTKTQNPELPGYPAGFITDDQARLGEQIACVGDTDGDGNCPLPMCPHCHPENFTVSQLRKIMHEQWPHRVLMVLVPRVEFADPATEVVAASANCPIVDDPRDERRLVRMHWTPVKDKADWMRRAEVMWEAYVTNLAERGIEVQS